MAVNGDGDRMEDYTDNQNTHSLGQECPGETQPEATHRNHGCSFCFLETAL